jgi:hypothetical protein
MDEYQLAPHFNDVSMSFDDVSMTSPARRASGPRSAASRFAAAWLPSCRESRLTLGPARDHRAIERASVAVEPGKAGDLGMCCYARAMKRSSLKPCRSGRMRPANSMKATSGGTGGTSWPGRAADLPQRSSDKR